MKRMYVLGALVTVGALAVTLKAYQAPAPAAMVVDAVKLKDNLYILSGGGGTTGVFIRNDGVVVIDTKNPGWGQPILNKIKELTPKPVTMIINTHTHLDHVAGNVEFPASVDVIAQENTGTNMKNIGPVTGLPLRSKEEYEIFPRHENRNLAKHTFKNRMTIGRGADQIDLYYFGRAHTSGDAWVVFPALRVAHAGDSFAFKQPPIMDANAGGTGLGYPATLRKAHSGIKNVDTIISGHTFPGTHTWPELQEYQEYLTSFVDYVRSQNKAGKSVDETAAAYKVPERFKGYSAPEPRVKANVGVIYDELKK